jgi:transcription termination/antitermination protein NusA
LQKTVCNINCWAKEMKFKLNSDTLLNMKLFSDITNISCTNCFLIDRTIIFTTKPGEAGKAIGTGGKNIKFLRTKLNKNVKVIEEADNCCDLIKNYLFPIKIKDCQKKTTDNNTITIELEFNSSRERRYLLDNQQKGLKEMKEVVSRYYSEIKDIRIL